jgi:hypothetical protein
VFYYHVTENKFYLADGFPGVSILENSQAVQALRDEKMKEIETEWNLFLNQLRKENKLQE